MGYVEGIEDGQSLRWLVISSADRLFFFRLQNKGLACSTYSVPLCPPLPLIDPVLRSDT